MSNNHLHIIFGTGPFGAKEPAMFDWEALDKAAAGDD